MAGTLVNSPIAQGRKLYATVATVTTKGTPKKLLDVINTALSTSYAEILVDYLKVECIGNSSSKIYVGSSTVHYSTNKLNELPTAGSTFVDDTRNMTKGRNINKHGNKISLANTYVDTDVDGGTARIYIYLDI